ncbi:enoyl-CoA hydratase/isomerase family protein [Undibacterium sp. RTI2.1]|uniref:enoyl-CoA hydratase/isomerase family protein n=1 Tax=unclassified Undibacterium TaxID=2630295 RepID=UPI002B23D054|nr:MULTISPECIES: enoyl-CoA hydratase/isomerase family protein [unclassified Undibacterium]MEB0032875.1 enoyl-CoA hydratase/isomerase family protein [Undibacterium sp. RTI2.1]MEB0118693.1 enoyl-CoA hydratase/isomerase family protein [Undibacterium sp. RTI2.2]
MQQATKQAIIYTVDDGIATLTLNRPSQKNALDMTMRNEIADVMSAIRHDRHIKSLIITGAGGAFCSGGDIRTMDADGTAEDGRGRMAELHLWLEELITLDRPVIAAVDGAAYGAGFGLALAADFIIATPRARFCLAFLRLGLIPDCGVFYTLPRIVGLQRAKELAFSAREITAEEAKKMGIVFEIQPEEKLAERAHEMAHSFTQGSQTAISLTKRAMNASLGSNLTTMLEMEATGQGLARSTSYHRDAVKRFLSKQALAFKWPGI